jgi:hypothetical protein
MKLGARGTPFRQAGAPMTRRGRHVASAAIASAWALVAGVTVALAADPSPTAAGGGDVRTDPAAPGLVGDPLLAIAGVVVIGLLAVGLTLLLARLADRR